MSKKGNCPMCGSDNCSLGWNDFFPTKKEVKVKKPVNKETIVKEVINEFTYKLIVKQ
jgi:hypothetical protein